jgi:hypothetical protein
MGEFRIDPIQYAWTSCDRGVVFPSVLRMKTNGADPLRPRSADPQSIVMTGEEEASRSVMHVQTPEP